ncbi:MAG: hypothetical protein IJI43_00555 [Bacilli bacterium]|nr:hypothetical protein [Bacilli bacterium]
MNDKKVLYTIVGAILVGIVLPITFSIYKANVEVNVITKTGKSACDFEIDTNDNYVDKQGKYFYVNVTNYEKDKNNIYLTDTDLDYKLTISNKDKSNMNYAYQNIENDRLEIRGEFSKEEKENNKYKIYIINNNVSRTKANINIKLEANQK